MMHGDINVKGGKSFDAFVKISAQFNRILEGSEFDTT
jgi:hypothetical protein